MKLYYITMERCFSVYVVANDFNEAEKIVKKYMKDMDYFTSEVLEIKVMADSYKYGKPNVLLLKGE